MIKKSFENLLWLCVVCGGDIVIQLASQCLDVPPQSPNLPFLLPLHTLCFQNLRQTILHILRQTTTFISN